MAADRGAVNAGRRFFEIGMVGAGDAEIAARAEAYGAVPVGKDEDFVTLRLPDRFAFVWLRCGNATDRALVAWLEVGWARVAGLLAAGERFVEVQ